MKKLIFRNLVKDIAVFFILASISLTLIAWVMQAVNYLDIVSEDGHGFKVYFMFTILSLPKLYGKLIIFLFFGRMELKKDNLLMWFYFFQCSF